MSSVNKYLHRILILLIFISVTASTYLFSTPKNNTAPLTTNTSTAPQVKIEEIKPTTLTENKVKNGTKKTEDKSTEQKPTSSFAIPLTTTPAEAETMPIKFKVEDKEYEINIKPNISAYEAMNALRELGQVSFSTKNFSGLGQFVEEINGIKNSPNTGFYWTFYINNEEAKVGISNYIIKPNDLITWKYENK